MLLTDTMKQLKFYWAAGGKATTTEDHFVDMSGDFEIKKNQHLSKIKILRFIFALKCLQVSKVLCEYVSAAGVKHEMVEIDFEMLET